MRTSRNTIRFATLLLVMTLSVGLEAMLGLERSARAQVACEGAGYGMVGGGDGATKTDAVKQAKDSAVATCNSYCAARAPCSEDKPGCKSAVKFNRMNCQLICGFGPCYWSCSAFYRCTCSCGPDFGNSGTAGADLILDDTAGDDVFADPDGVQLGAATEYPFEGSWVGVYEVPDLNAEGTVEFQISESGVLHGRSIVNTEGDYHTLSAQVHSDGQMRGVAIPNVHG